MIKTVADDNVAATSVETQPSLLVSIEREVSEACEFVTEISIDTVPCGLIRALTMLVTGDLMTSLVARPFRESGSVQSYLSVDSPGGD